MSSRIINVCRVSSQEMRNMMIYWMRPPCAEMCWYEIMYFQMTKVCMCVRYIYNNRKSQPKILRSLLPQQHIEEYKDQQLNDLTGKDGNRCELWVIEAGFLLQTVCQGPVD